MSETLHLPGDKSISHRALLLAALSHGDTRIEGLLVAEDVRATYDAVCALGVSCSPFAPSVTVHGRGPSALRSPVHAVDCGNSGTTARLLAGVIAGAPSLNATLVGDASLSRRPMRRVAEPLRAMGAAVGLSADGTLPLQVRGAALRDTEYHAPVSTAQVKSAVLLAACTAGVSATVHEPAPSRDHTERMLRARGIRVSTHMTSDGCATHMDAGHPIMARDVRVPGDASSAAVLAALAVLMDDVSVRLADVGVNPTRLGWVQLMQRMGARLTVTTQHDGSAIDEEPVGEIHARSSPLRGITIGRVEATQAIDELVLLACVAARAEGITVIEGAGELRVKESDRIHCTVENLRAIGVRAEARADGMIVHGSTDPLHGVVRTAGDHRQAMAFGVLGALPGNAISIDNPGCVRVSFPTFWEAVRRVRAASEGTQPISHRQPSV